MAVLSFEQHFYVCVLKHTHGALVFRVRKGSYEYIQNLIWNAGKKQIPRWELNDLNLIASSHSYIIYGNI